MIESTLKETFSYDIINYLMLMMVDKQVHYHVLPRYETTIDFAGLSWKDIYWPGIPDLSGDETEKNILNEIMRVISKSIVL